MNEIVVIPCYNSQNGGRNGETRVSLLHVGTVVVVDDGDTDCSAAIARASGVRVSVFGEKLRRRVCTAPWDQRE